MSKGLFVGLCGLDVVFYENAPLPSEDYKMKASDVRSCIGGPAANAAITFALLGGNSTVITYIGNSPVGTIIKQQMADLGIKVIDMCQDEDVKCISSIYVNTRDATRTILSGRNPIHSLRNASVLIDAMKECDFLLYDGHFSQLDDTLLEESKRQNKELIIDVGGWKDSFKKILQNNPTLICSEVFQENAQNGIELMDRYGYDRAAITRGSRPILYKTKDMIEPKEIVVPAVNAVDTLGAGDVFHGAYCYFSQIAKLNFRESLTNAAKVAAVSTTVYGVIPGVKEYLKQTIAPSKKYM